MDTEREKPKVENNSEGYSEKQQDIDAEINAGEWQDLKKFKTYQRRSRQWKIIATYRAISNRLSDLSSFYYKLVAKDTKAGEKMLKQMKHLRMLQEILAACMIWEPKGELSETMVPKEIWDLIK